MSTTWTDLYMRHLTRPEYLVVLMAHAWRQAVEYGDQALWSTLACNSYSVSGMCDLLLWRGVYPDDRTMQWAIGVETYHTPLPSMVKVRKP